MKIFISACQPVKSGVKNGKNWTLYTILDPKGVRYSTFEAKYVGMVGQDIEVDVQESPSKTVNPKTGEPYTNRTIVEPKIQGNQGMGFVLTELKRLGGKIDELHRMVSDLVIKPSEPDVELENDISPDMRF